MNRPLSKSFFTFSQRLALEKCRLVYDSRFRSLNNHELNFRKARLKEEMLEADKQRTELYLKSVTNKTK